MDITELISYTNLAIVGICLCVGYIIKNLIPSDKINRFIPLIMGVLGVVCAIWVESDFTLTIVLSGLMSGLTSTGLYEVFKNLINGGKSE